LASKSARKRFEREIELVAQLKHPNIIVIFDSGVTPEGWHYYAMDYIRGLPLNRYVQQERLTLEETLEVFSKVCDAVQYAHQKGVIHRDLKPSNILVDSEGSPKVLDFGLAKQLAAPIDTVVSMTQDVIGTLPYMSPEQARGNPDSIDTRTDIYALGVILYEILTGHYPYPVAGHMAEVLRHIAETPPTPPSRQWTADSGVTKRSSRHVRAGKCPIDDELQTVILKTLSKERGRRYQSAGDLARDLGHYLAGEPLDAKRDSGWYMLKKALQRNKIPFGIAATFLVLLAVFAVERYAHGRAVDRLNSQLTSERNRASTFAHTLVNASLSLEKKDWDEAISDIKEVLGADWSAVDPVEAAVRSDLVNEGQNLALRGFWDDAWDKYTEARLIDADDYAVLANMAWWKKEVAALRKTPTGKVRSMLKEANELCDQALAVREGSAGLWNLKSVILLNLGNLKDAERASRSALKITPDYFYAKSNLAKILALQGKFTEALQVADEGARIQKEQDKPGKYEGDIWRTLGALQLHLGKPEALESILEAQDIDTRDTRTWLLLARIYLTMPGHIDEAEALLTAYGAANFTTLGEPKMNRILAQAQLRNGRYEDAITNAEAAIEGGDLEAVCHLISAIAHAKLGDRPAAADELIAASMSWPAEFESGEDVIVTAEKGLLWFDTRAELEALRLEADQLIGSPEP
ncbi:MAG: protein kinase, partial [Planctomycetes bacterium]|nr:protein kinase [Planctomycetota bacterium]